MNLDEILDNIDQYTDNIDDLVRNLKLFGINSFDKFKNIITENKISVSRSIQDQVAKKFISSEDDDWNEAIRNNTIEAFQKYISLYPDGKYIDSAKKNVADLQKRKDIIASDEDWKSVNKNNVEELNDFINKYPDSIHVNEARELCTKLKYVRKDISTLSDDIINIITNTNILSKDDAIYDEIKKYIDNKYISDDILLSKINDDKNFISGYVFNKLHEKGYIKDEDCQKIKIHDDFIKKALNKEYPKQLDAARDPFKKITKNPSTEIYFWGIPHSGKSCAIGAILNVANNGNITKSMNPDTNCQGWGYMNQLLDLFENNEIVVLPDRTMAAEETTYEMGIDLTDKKGKVHPITFIDLAGEAFCDIHKLLKNGVDSLTHKVRPVLEVLDDILVNNRTDNRKMHFFVIEYGAENRKYKDVSQKQYLESCMSYIKDKGIFDKDTDAVFILITKSDKIKIKEGDSIYNHIKKYIEEKYNGFYKKIKDILKDKEINGGDLVVLPFSLGEVCLQYYCMFDASKTEKVIEEILKRSITNPGNRLIDKIINKLKS